MGKNDYSLIYTRSENARMTIKAMSKLLKKSSQRLKYSLSVLEKIEILGQSCCIFDYSYFGLILFRVYYKGAYVSEKDKNRIIKVLDKNPFIISIYELTGEYDLVIDIASPNPSKFNKVIKNLALTNPTLNDYKIILNLVTYNLPRHYLTRSSTLQNLNIEKIIGGDRIKENFNNNEILVMKALLLSPTASFTTLAKNTKLNNKTIKTILENLKKRKIICGFKYIIDTNKLSINKYRLFIKLHNITLDKESSLTKYLLNSKEIVQINKTVGDWDLEIDIEATDKTKIRSIIQELREGYKELIERFNLIEFYNYYKRSYLPMFYFNDIENSDNSEKQ